MVCTLLFFFLHIIDEYDSSVPVCELFLPVPNWCSDAEVKTPLSEEIVSIKTRDFDGQLEEEYDEYDENYERDNNDNYDNYDHFENRGNTVTNSIGFDLKRIRSMEFAQDLLTDRDFLVCGTIGEEDEAFDYIRGSTATGGGPNQPTKFDQDHTEELQFDYSSTYGCFVIERTKSTDLIPPNNLDITEAHTPNPQHSQSEWFVGFWRFIKQLALTESPKLQTIEAISHVDIRRSIKECDSLHNIHTWLTFVQSLAFFLYLHI